MLYLPRTQEETDALGQPLLDKDGEPKVRHFGIIREFRLFNLSQCDGLPQSLSEPFTRPAEPVEMAEAITMNSGVTLPVTLHASTVPVLLERNAPKHSTPLKS